MAVDLECTSGSAGLFLTDANARDMLGGEVRVREGSPRRTLVVDSVNPAAQQLCVRTAEGGPAALRLYGLQCWQREKFDATEFIDEVLPALLLQPGDPALERVSAALSERLRRMISPNEVGALEVRRDNLKVPFRRLFDDKLGRIVLDETEQLIALLETYDHRKFSERTEDRALDTGAESARTYLKQSTIRVYHLAQLLQEVGCASGTVLEQGTFFGQSACVLQRLGYQTTAVDRYGSFNGALDEYVKHMRELGVNVIEATWENEEATFKALPAYDAVVSMAVIEHIPHTPREFLKELIRHVRPGGIIALDTPNIARYWNRRYLAEGKSIHQEIDAQFYSPIPFEGHHREYTAAEMVWMLEQMGCRDVQCRLFDYNLLQFDQLTPDHIAALLSMTVDPSLADTILVAGRVT
ncbi:MAG: class I SAM-dependent methyltransferase [Candidatus Eremiobacteraeota bacterium]|nr:class I SAM-dependent methyltransferase [Candidatus Eremiobacteraeota bacterium]